MFGREAGISKLPSLFIADAIYLRHVPRQMYRRVFRTMLLGLVYHQAMLPSSCEAPLAAYLRLGHPRAAHRDLKYMQNMYLNGLKSGYVLALVLVGNRHTYEYCEAGILRISYKDLTIRMIFHT